jgi:Fe-S oxidoreductase
MLGMRFLPKFGCCGSSHESAGDVKAEDANLAEESIDAEDSHFLKTIGWVSAALGAVALGLIVGRELRERYKFNRRTPYDLYAHSGDELPDVDSGLGI